MPKRGVWPPKSSLGGRFSRGRGLRGLRADDLPDPLRAGGAGGLDREADPQRREGAEGAETLICTI